MTTSTRNTAGELAERLRRRELSSVELTRATFASIAEQDASLGAFVELDERRALAAAEAADRLLRAGGTLPPFLGVPTAIKDSEHVRFLHTRVGSRAFKWIRSPIDSKLAQRCRKAGFVIVGKTTSVGSTSGGRRLRARIVGTGRAVERDSCVGQITRLRSLGVWNGSVAGSGGVSSCRR